MRRLRTLGSISLATLACTASTAFALPGDLDPTFGDGGRVITDFGAGDLISDAALQPDGKIVVAGGVASRLAVARYNPDGSLDPSFSDDGLVVTSAGGVGASAVALMPDGRIVAAGQTPAGPNPRNLSFVRYNPDGSLDPTLDGDGVVTTDLGASEITTDMEVLGDGRIVAAVRTFGGPEDLIVVRYAPNGTLDGSFGAGGVASFDLGGDEAFEKLALLPDGRVVLAGHTDTGQSFDAVLVQLTAEGSLDGSFDSDGLVVTDAGPAEVWGTVARQSDGKLIAVGVQVSFAGMGAENAMLARYNPDGSLDGSFGNGGFALPDLGPQAGIGRLAIQPDGKLVVETPGFSVARLTSVGVLDPEFGSGGVAPTGFGESGFLSALLVQADGAIVAAGTTEQGPNPENFALTRFLGGDRPVCRGRTATIVGTAGVKTNGTPGDDVIVGTDESDRIKSGKGRDRVCTLGGRDRASTGGGKDVAAGGKGKDLLRGGAARDTLRGDAGNDRLNGGAGRDLLVGGKGRRDDCVDPSGADKTRSC